MLEELNRVAKEVSEMYGKYSFFPSFRAMGDDNHPAVQVTIKGFWELAYMADQKPEKGYYYKGNREYHFYYKGVEYFALSKEEEN